MKYDEIEQKNYDISEVRIGEKIGFIQTSTKKPLTPVKYDQYSNMYGFSDECPLASVAINEKYALMDTAGKLLTDFLYSDIDLLNYHQEKMVVSIDKKQGILNSKGEILMPCEYDFIYQEFKERNQIRVQKKDLWGVFDLESKKEILPCKYQEADWQNQNLISVQIAENKTSLFRIEKAKAENVLSETFEEILCIQEPYYFVKKANKWALINKNQKFAESKINFEEVEYVANNEFYKYFMAQKNGFWAILLPDGKMLFDHIFTESDVFFSENGYSEVSIKNGKAIISEKGKIVLQGEYDVLHLDDDAQTIRFLKNEKYGLMYLNGDIILPNEYDFLGEYDHTWYGLKDFNKLVKNDKIGFANIEGKVFTECIYDNSGCLQDNSEVGWIHYEQSYFGLMAVEKGKKWGLIDQKGNTVLPFEYDRIECPNTNLGIIEKGTEKMSFDWENQKIVK